MHSQTTSMLVALLPLLNTVRGLAGAQITAFVEPGCDYAGDYAPFSLGDGYPSCTQNYFGNYGFQKVNDQYNATFLIPDLGEGCKIFIRAPSNVDDPGCGEPIAIFSKSQCTTLTFPDPFDLNFCCGDGDCTKALSSKRKREVEVESAEPKETARKTKRSNCAYAANGNTFTADGQTQRIGSTIDCTQSAGCSDSFMAGVTTGSSQTFGVSESTEAGLFDIISETVSFDYSYTYEMSTTSQVSFSYDIADGVSGYISWSPELQCTTGSFSGSDCQGMSIPTDSQGTSCIPVTSGNVAGGSPVGTSHFVSTEQITLHL